MANYEMLNYLKINIVYKKTEPALFDFIKCERRFASLYYCDLKAMYKFGSVSEQHRLRIPTDGVDLWTRKVSIGCLKSHFYFQIMFVYRAECRFFPKTNKKKTNLFKAAYSVLPTIMKDVPLWIQETPLLMC